ncbi:uncharacterized protein LOC110883123 [Helianthus annuus]|uniref:uncharacterized protein LOC110883123 n=1 Tax=Helianthus annuus TaxID=4232 RepID=UPI000B908260|nr:uncharacterized protein LOC110883123 [Helianthus annuus]
MGGVWQKIVSDINKPLSGNFRLRNFFRGSVGRGNEVLFWLDPWIKDIPLCEVYPNLFALETVKDCSVRDRLMGVWLWKHDLDRVEEIMEWSVLSADLALVSLNNECDSWKWLGDSSGLFSVSSVRQLLEKSVASDSDFVMDWCSWIPIKCNVLAWRADLDRIPTADALRRRRIVIGDGLYPLCRSEEESVDHLFTSCIVTSVIWQKVSRWCRTAPVFVFSFRDLLNLHKYGSFRAGEKGAFKGIIRVAVWCLWLARNNALFSASKVKVESIFCDILSLGYLWFKNRIRNNPISWLDWRKFAIM